MSTDCKDCAVALVAIQSKLDGIETQLSKVSDTVEHLEQRLFIGNGSESWSVRLDRIEQIQDRRKTNNILLWTTVFGILACIIGEHVFSWIEKPNQPQTISAKP